MNWIDINEELPPNNYYYKTYLVTVICGSWTKTMVMDWECTTVRNKPVSRWKWNDKLVMSAWIVTHWMELPKPYIKE